MGNNGGWSNSGGALNLQDKTLDVDETPTDLVDRGLAIIPINGLGLGKKVATIVTLKDTIEAAANNTNVYDITALSSTGWSNASGVEATGRRTQVTTSLPIFGTKSLVCANTGDGRFGVAYDTGGTIQDIFIRDYVRIDHASTGGQWKMVRIAAENCVTDDALTNAYFSNQHGYSFDFFFTQVGNGCGNSTANPVGSNYVSSFSTTFGVWYEREIRIKPSSAANATDGIVSIKFRRVSDWVQVSSNVTTTMKFYNSGEVNRNRYLIFQNYQGNGTFDSANSTVYMDNTWISNGDQARVYLSPADTWTEVLAGAPRELQDIQDDDDWVLNDYVGIKLRQGMLDNLSGKKAFVVAPDGTVNENGIIPLAA